MNDHKPRLDWLITELSVLGGAETYVRRMAPILQKRGWKIRVITFSQGGFLSDELRQQSVPVIELSKEYKSLPISMHKLIRLWRSDPPDILHTHLYHAGMAGRWIAHLLGIRPVIVHQHGAEQARSHIRSLLDRNTSRMVSRYIVTCQVVAKILTEREKIDPEKILVIYNGVTSQIAQYTNPPLDWPVPPGANCLGCVGRLSPEKGQDTLIRSVAILVNEGLPIHLVLVGKGESLTSLKKLCRQLSVHDLVHFVGIRRETHNWLQYFDLFVLPSRWEGVSIALLEAMATGTPVVATAVGGTPEVIRNGNDGILIPPDDPSILAEVIKDLIRNPQKRARLGANARTRIEQEFSIDHSIDALENIYFALTSEKGTGS